jgi:glycosyltransferase involved in cell wall biosynthesis
MTAGDSAQQHTPTLSVVVPAYNEERGLPGTLLTLSQYLVGREWSWEVRVVDDGSRDGTRQVVEEFSRSEPRVVLQAEPHRGKGAAVRAGMLASRAAYRFMCDADLSMPVHEIDRFMPPALGDTDVAIGSREGIGARRVGEPLFRHLAGRVFNSLVRLSTIRDIQDTQCGFKMFTAAAADAIFPRVTIDGWAFDIEVLYLARLYNFKIREVPIEWHFRADSRLRMGRDAIAMLGEVMRVRQRARRGAYSG